MSATSVLLVNDNPTFLESAGRLLRHAGYRVLEASTGSAAIEFLVRDEFALALIDFRLGDMTGFDVVKAMKNRGRDVPWILVTGYVDYEVAREAGRLGARGAKAFPIDVVEVIADALKIVSSSTAGRSWQFTITGHADHVSTADRSADLVVQAFDVDSDPATIHAWALAVGACETTIYAICKISNISARSSRDFARVLRALRLSRGFGCGT